MAGIENTFNTNIFKKVQLLSYGIYRVLQFFIYDFCNGINYICFFEKRALFKIL